MAFYGNAILLFIKDQQRYSSFNELYDLGKRIPINRYSNNLNVVKITKI